MIPVEVGQHFDWRELYSKGPNDEGQREKLDMSLKIREHA